MNSRNFPLVKPPQIVLQAIRSMRIRCITTGTVAANFGHNNMAGFIGVTAITAVTSTFLSTCYRLRSVEIWNPSTTTGVGNACFIQWVETSNDFVSPPMTVSDQSSSTDHVAHIKVAPPKGSLADKWHTSTQTDIICAMTTPTGATIDFVFDWVLNDQGGINAGPALAAATPGVIYHKIYSTVTPLFVNTI
jgi:hypothetical protein